MNNNSIIKIIKSEFFSYSSDINPSKGKPLCFALMIIGAVGGLILPGVGLFITDIDLTLMVIAGGAGGICFLVGLCGIIGQYTSVGRSLGNHPNPPVSSKDLSITSKTPQVDPLSSSAQVPELKTNGPGVIKKAEKEIGNFEFHYYGKEFWEEHLGMIGEEPPLPENIVEILNEFSPFYPEKTVQETHLALVLIPATVDGVPLTLNNLRTVFQKSHLGIHPIYDCYGPNVQNELGARSFPSSYWVLMTQDLLPQSYQKSYEEQKEIVLREPGYHLPRALEVIVCSYIYYISSNQRLYSAKTQDETFKEAPHTRCEEIVAGKPVVVGNFSEKGIDVFSPRVERNCPYYGVNAVRRF